MNKVFQIRGYFVDDNSPIDSLVCEYDDTPKGYSDEDIFFYGLSESNIQEAIKTGEPVDDFVITSYQEVI